MSDVSGEGLPALAMSIKMRAETDTAVDSRVLLFQREILTYWDENGRKNLPWRLTIDPWKILLAEILLRKTTSAQAVEVFNDMAGFSPADVAEMRNDQLENLLRPIGMFRVRALQIRMVAEAVAKQGANALAEADFLDNLPGVGPYIRNAVLCFAFGMRKPALDTNMIRVLQRVFGIKTERRRARDDKALWLFAESIMPTEHYREFNWGILDLAATLCTPREPKHKDCPLNSFCGLLKEVKP